MSSMDQYDNIGESGEKVIVVGETSVGKTSII